MLLHLATKISLRVTLNSARTEKDKETVEVMQQVSYRNGMEEACITALHNSLAKA